MISFALMLMTLPSRMVEIRAERAVQGGLPDSSWEGSGGSSVRDGNPLDKSSSATRGNASPARTGRYNKEG